MRMSVIGTGYLGATHAAAMAELGHEVFGVDVDDAKIARLQHGEVPFYEPGLQELLGEHVSAGRLRFTTSMPEGVSGSQVHFVCVATPQKKGEFASDLSQVDSAIFGLAETLSPDSIVVGKSTVPAGTAVRIAKVISTAAASWSGIRSSYARDMPSRTPSNPTGSFSACKVLPAPRRCRKRMRTSSPPTFRSSSPITRPRNW